MEQLVERFLSYVKIDTESQESDVVPSTDKQRNLARLLKKELKELGASDVRMDEEHCYVYATIPATVEGKAPVLGFVAHMDTSPAVSGKDVKPRVVKNYDGGDVVLNEEQQIVLRRAEFPELTGYQGQDLIVTDGTTLLGADDKAGVAEIMTAAAYLLKHTELPHGTIRIGFTPDEEVGRGVDFFDVEGFQADYAFTVDGGPVGELEYENFNAASARLTINGVSIHPGSAKNRMVNAILLAGEFQSLLPAAEDPALTEGYEGFYHATDIRGCVEKTVVDYIIRDHDREKFEAKKAWFAKCCEFLNVKYGEGTFVCELKDSYYNMKEKIKPHMHLIENAKKAMEEAGVTPVVSPIRGGTDGARLSFMGLPCPNLFTGGHNFHGRYEFISVQSMEKAVEVILNLVRIYGQYKEEN